MTSSSPEPERNGVQWQNVGPIAGLFLVSWSLAYALERTSQSWSVRAEHGLNSAALVFLVTLLAVRVIARVVGRSRVESVRLLAVVWFLVAVAWLLLR
jgi:hypothetical protein